MRLTEKPWSGAFPPHESCTRFPCPVVVPAYGLVMMPRSITGTSAVVGHPVGPGVGARVGGADDETTHVSVKEPCVVA